MRRKKYIKIILVIAVILVIGIFFYIAAGAVLPYINQPSVSQETKDRFVEKEFYGDHPSGERARIISDNGEALEERIRLISHAKERIVLSTFEFRSDTSGKKILAALLDAAKRGVEVSILADGFPGMVSMERNPYFYALSSFPGIQIRLYNPIRPWKPWMLMARMHDKYLIVDETAYILGGRNSYDYFLGDQPGHKNYDWDVLVYCEKRTEAGDGSLEQLLAYFYSVWNLPVCEAFHDEESCQQSSKVQKAKKELEMLYEEIRKEHKEWFADCSYEETTRPVNHIKLLSNPVDAKIKEPVVFYEMTELMKRAEKEVFFHTPYIICDNWMLQRLQDICGQKAQVRMMTNSVANNGNLFGAMDYQKNREEILKTGVSVLEYDGGVSYHGKCFTVDERLTGIGSFNWDMRSAYLDTELMLVIDSRELNQDMRTAMAEYEEGCLLVLDAENSSAPDGSTVQEISKKKQRMMNLIRAAAGWARFLL